MSPIAMSPTVPPNWRATWTVLGIALAASLWLYGDTVRGMLVIWTRSETFTHCYLVPPIVAWLIWRRRHELHAQPVRPNLWFLLLLPLLTGIWLLADLAAINALTQLVFVMALILLVPTLLGAAATKVILFPLAFTIFSVPMGDFLMPWFMEWTADFTVAALRMTGIPVYREGLQFVIPTGNWSVVEACSGIRYLIASLTVGTLFAYLNYRSFGRRALFMLVSVVVPIIANWMRAYMIVMLGHLSGNRLAVGVDHIIYGWVFFGVVILLMFMVGARWAEPDAPIATGPATQGASPSAGASFMITALVAAIAMLSVAPAARWWILRDGDGGAASLRWSLPVPAANGWIRVDEASTAFTPAFESPRLMANALYRASDQVVGVYVGFYRSQTAASKLVSSNNVLIRSNDRNWATAGESTQTMTFGERAVPVRVALLRALPLDAADSAAGLVVWRVYWVNGIVTTSDYVAKAYSAMTRLMGRGDDSAVIIVYGQRRAGVSAEPAMREFLSSHFTAIERALMTVEPAR